MTLRQILFALALVCFLNSGTRAAEIEISAPGRELIPLAVPLLLPLSGAPLPALADSFAAALQGDLELSGLFSLVPPQAFLGDAARLGLNSTEVDFEQWRQLGAQALVKGGYSVSDSGELLIEARLFDPVGRRLLVGRRYRGRIGDERRIAHSFADQILRSLTGSEGPFSSRIAFIASQGGAKELWLMDVDGSQAVRLTNHRSIVLNPDFAPQGRELIFTSYKAGKPDLYRKEIYSGQEARISSRSGINIAARFRPDGREIALTLSHEGNSELYLLGNDGSMHKRLTNDWGIDVDPAWSPGGDRLVFVSDRSGQPQLYLRDLAGGTERRLTFNGKYNVTPAWSPLGDRIVFSRLEERRFDLYSIRPDGSDERRLTSGPGNKEHPRFSPDGRFLVFSSDHEGTRGIYLMRIDGGGLRRISPAGIDCGQPAWSGRW